MHVILFLLVVFISNILQVITGFAGTLLAMPAAIKLIGVGAATASLNVVGLVLSLIIVKNEKQYVNIKELKRIVVIMFIGMTIGIILYRIIQLDSLLIIYGIVICIVAVLKLLKFEPHSYSRGMLLIILFIAGVIHGMFVSGGAFLVIYASICFKEKHEFRATVSCVWIFLNSFLLLWHIISGNFDLQTIELTLFAVLSSLGSVYVGGLVFKKINLNVFLNITYILLLCSGLMLIF